MEETERKYPVRTEGPMSLTPMPTEVLKDEIAELQRKLSATEAELARAQRERCPDLNCPNCRKWRAWEARNGDVDWKVCPTCQAGVGEPCRHIGRGVGRGYAPVLTRPHRGRPGELRRDPQDSPL